MKTLKLVAIAGLCFWFAGCNAYTTAQRAHDIVAAVIAVAQADLPSLETTGVFSASEGQAVTGYLTAATKLNGQYETCITNAQNTMLKTSGKFLACLNTFAGGLANPQELATLRVMNPKAQGQMQLWITAASVGVSSVIAALGGQAPAAPQVAQASVRSADLANFIVHTCNTSATTLRECMDANRVAVTPYIITEPYCPAGSACLQ